MQNFLQNYYNILKVSDDATADEIKSAYRALAKVYHPDVNPGNSIAEEYFKKINEAYEVLRDPIKRQWYNLMLKGNEVRHQIDPRKYGTRRYAGTPAPKYEEAEEAPKTPFWLQQLVLVLAMIYCLLIIYNNWFLSYEGAEHIKIVFSFLVFVVCAYFFINNKYNQWRSKATTFNPEKRSLLYFLLLFFLTIPSFFLIGITRKTIQLRMYPEVTQATVIEYKQRFEEYWVGVLYFDKNNIPYNKAFTFESMIPLRRSDYSIYVKYSRLEPRIMKFHVKLLGEDSVFQELFDNLNKGDNYFVPDKK